MEALTLLLIFITMTGYCHVLEPKLSRGTLGPEGQAGARVGGETTALQRGRESQEKTAALSTAERSTEEEWGNVGLTPRISAKVGRPDDDTAAKERGGGEGLIPGKDPWEAKGGERGRASNHIAGFDGKTGGPFRDVIIAKDGAGPQSFPDNVTLREGRRMRDGFTEVKLEIERRADEGMTPDSDAEGTGTHEGGRTAKDGAKRRKGDGAMLKRFNVHSLSRQEETKGSRPDPGATERGRAERKKQGMDKEERANKLVAGIHLQEGSEGTYRDGKNQVGREPVETVKEGENIKETERGEAATAARKAIERAEEGVGHLTRPTSAASYKRAEEGEMNTSATLRLITPSPSPPTSPPCVSDYHLLAPPLVALRIAPQTFPSQVSSSLPGVTPMTIHHSGTPSAPSITGQVVAPSPDGQQEKSALVFDSYPIEVPYASQPPFKQKLSEVKVEPTATLSISLQKAEDVRMNHKVLKSPSTEVLATHKIKYQTLLQSPHNPSAGLPKLKVSLENKTSTVIQPIDSHPFFKEPIAKEQETTPETLKAHFTTQNLQTTLQPTSKDSNSAGKPTPKSKLSRSTGIPKGHLRSLETETKFTPKHDKAPQVSKPSAMPQTPWSAGKTTLMKNASVNKGSRRNKSKKKESKGKSKRKKGKKSNETKKPHKKEVELTTPTYSPFFKDNYCPLECACYGRVVQCSDKGVDKVPYGIPYNARYVLLMHNLIDSIQLDLLREYISMELLVLSNNRLTDGTIEGAFEGVPALKRLYLDRNLLESVPTDLPASLEELHLDNNNLKVMSQAAWGRCPGILVLSLSNNSLGNGSESLPNGVLSSLRNLRTLNLDYNQLAAVPQGLPWSIKELYLRGNLIQHFREGTFLGTSELVVVDLSCNRLTNKGLFKESLLNVTHLESLNLGGNQFKRVPRHLPPSLKTLNLEGNLISSINTATFRTLPNLEHLGLAKNKIFRVAPGAFRTLPALHQLDLCHNALRQVPRLLPSSLHSAALAHNRIQSVPHDAFCWDDETQRLSGLVRVQLEHNLIDMGNLDARAFRCLRGFQVVHFY